MNSLFIAYGRIVYSPGDLHLSYRDASQLLQRRFFCEMGQHTIGYQSQVLAEREACLLTPELISDYCSRLISHIHSYNRKGIDETLGELKSCLYYSNEHISEIKLFLTDLFLQIKDKINNLYGHIKIPFLTNSQIIDFIGKSYYLYEIFLFFTEQFEMIFSSIDNSSCDSVIEDVLSYINRNYTENLKLKTISSLFGYNSSYLGKIIKARLGETFNTYLDRLRIENSMKLLEFDTLKIYEVAEKVGYCNVDYFVIKFKKFMGISPKEYRKQLHGRQQ